MGILTKLGKLNLKNSTNDFRLIQYHDEKEPNAIVNEFLSRLGNEIYLLAEAFKNDVMVKYSSNSPCYVDFFKWFYRIIKF